MPFVKEDLACRHYHWDDNNAASFKGQPDRRSFDRNNGEQVLYMINFYGALSDRISIKEGLKMEEIINDLPGDSNSELSVFNWLRKVS